MVNIFFRFNSTASLCLSKSVSKYDQLNCLSEIRSNINIRLLQADGTEYEYGWFSPLTVNGTVVQDEQNYPRYENKFTNVPWGSKIFNITSIAGHNLYLDFSNMT